MLNKSERILNNRGFEFIRSFTFTNDLTILVYYKYSTGNFFFIDYYGSHISINVLLKSKLYKEVKNCLRESKQIISQVRRDKKLIELIG